MSASRDYSVDFAKALDGGAIDFAATGRLIDQMVNLKFTPTRFASQTQFHPTGEFAALTSLSAPSPNGTLPKELAYTPIPGEEIAIQLGSKTYVVTLTNDPDDFRVKSAVDGTNIKVAADVAAKLFGAERAFLLLQRLYDVDHVENSSAQWQQIDDYLNQAIALDNLATILAHAAGLVIGSKFKQGIVPGTLASSFLLDTAGLPLDVVKAIYANLAVRDASDALESAHTTYLGLAGTNSGGGTLSYEDIQGSIDLTLSSLRTGSSIASYIADFSELQGTVWDELREFAFTAATEVLGALVPAMSALQEFFFDIADTTNSVANLLDGLKEVVDFVNFIGAVSRSDLVRFEPLTATGLANSISELQDSHAVNPNKPVGEITQLVTGTAGAVFTPTAPGTISYNGAEHTDAATINFSFLSTAVSANFQGANFYRAQTPDGYVVNLSNIARVTVLGGSANDSIFGGSDNDIIFGNAGDDHLYSSQDFSFGVGGTDIFLGGEGNDVIRDSGIGSAIDGGAGLDYLELNKSGLPEPFMLNMVQSAAGITQTLESDFTTIRNVEQLNLTTGSGDDDVVFCVTDRGTQFWQAGDGNDTVTADASNVALDTYWINSGLVFGSYVIQYQTSTSGNGDLLVLQNVENFSIAGGALGDVLVGLGGDDALSGNGGNDSLSGSQGSNTLNGGAGKDQISDGGDGSTIDGGTGTDHLSLSRPVLLTPLMLDMVASAHGVIQTLSDDTTVVNVETISLDSGFGDDSVSFYVADSTFQRWNAGDGTDTATLDLSSIAIDQYSVRAFWTGFEYRIQYQIGAANPVILATLSNIENFAITGGSLGDNLNGMDGDDTLVGNGGDDTLIGQHGTNELYGGTGRDQLYDDNGSASTIDGGAGSDYLNLIRSGAPSAIVLDMVAASQGVIQMLSDGTSVVNVEKITLTTGFGDDSVVFNIVDADLQQWDGGSGSDTATIDLSNAPLDAYWINGFLSGSTYRIQYRQGGSATDLITLSNVENFVISGGSLGDNIAAVGGNDTLVGNGGVDNLDGGAGTDNLSGGDGNDTLRGGTGNDHLTGGNGIDRLIGDNGGDILEGGIGADIYVYSPASDSTPSSPDKIIGFDFLSDRFDLDFAVTGIDPSRTATTLSNISQVLNSSRLLIHHAALVTLSSNGLQFLVIDTNGVAGYQKFQDLIINLDTPANIGSLDTGDFI